MKRKGFFLSLTAFIILSFIVASLAYKFVALEESRETYTELIKLSEVSSGCKILFCKSEDLLPQLIVVN